MAEQRHLNNAPITEAVLDFRCRTEVKIDSEKLKLLRKEIAYTGLLEEMHGMSFTFQQGPGASPSQKTDDHGLVGGRFLSENGKFVVQMRVDGMTFSRMKPYTEWGEVFPEASRLWKIFCAQMQVTEVSRIAVRNINRLLLPASDFTKAPGDFLSPPPSQPCGVDGNIAQWMTRFIVSDPIKDLHAIVTQLSDIKIESPDRYALIFDIDVFSTKELSTNPQMLLPRFVLLRELKNHIFFSALTERSADLFA
jgi:uncharacterized protein (TIGR04255 family)